MVGLLISLIFASSFAQAVDVVVGAHRPTCKEITLNSELRVYKDPSLFLSNASLIQSDRDLGLDSLMEETPLLTTVRRTVNLMVLGSPTPFRNFGYISILYGMVEPKLASPRTVQQKRQWKKSPPMIVPVKLCGASDPYQDSLGFVLVADLDRAQNSVEDGKGLPPSIAPNPVPALRQDD